MFFVLFLLFGCVSVSGVITVHVVPHTHDDVGWLKTVDEYYLGANNSIQDAGVQYILDTVVDELEKDPSRTFIYVEIAFFYRWWNEQDASMRTRVRNLIKSGQLEFINGGWCMNDEAGTSDEAIITQMTRGHQFLLETFNVTPTVGWQVDPFGHSNTMMSLFSQMGYSSVFFARMDYQDYTKRAASGRLQFVWRSSQSLGKQSDIFAHQMFDHTYCYPDGFDFEDGDAPINDDVRLENVNIQQRAEEFVKMIQGRVSAYPSGKEHILVTFGCDFAFQNARINYKNMDKLKNYINDNSEEYGLHVIYSTPSRFAQAVNAMNISFTLKTDDIFPYADRPYAYWTGYLTSRPALKAYVRSRNALLKTVDKLVALNYNMSSLSVSTQLRDIDVLRRAFSVSQHHDAVAGTEKQHVADDYAKLLSNGTVTAQGVIQALLPAMTGLKGFQFCEFLNRTVCPPLTNALKQNLLVPIVVYNSLAWNRTLPVTVPAPQGSTVSGLASQGWNNPFNNNWEITFIAADVPPLGYRVFYIVPPSQSPKQQKSKQQFAVNSTSISNGYYGIDFDNTGALSAINGMSFRQDYLWYNESAGNNKNSTQAGGAYIFRPNSTTPYPMAANINLNTQYTRGEIFSAASQTFGSYVQSIVKVYNTLPFFEITSLINTIDISDQMGKNVIHRYTSTIESQETIYTDSNWEEMQERIYNYRFSWQLNVTNPVAGNYYPMNSMCYIQQSDMQLSVVTDRSRGVASLVSGQIESMLHRRLLFDDQRGVGEPLNETEPIITVERLTLQTPSPSFRTLALDLNHPFQIVVASGVTQINSNVPTSYSGLLNSFPPELHMMDFYLIDTNNAILRVRHLYTAKEGAKRVYLQMEDCFKRRITAVDETQLTTVQPISYLNQRMQWKVQGESQQPTTTSTLKTKSFGFFFNPMQIRTFKVTFA